MALALLEALNEFGAMQHFGVDTFTTGIFRVWLADGSPAGAAKLASIDRVRSLRQSREQVEHLLDAQCTIGSAARPAGGQILPHRQRRKYLLALGHVTDAQGADLVVSPALDRSATEAHIALGDADVFGAHEAGDRR